jgi:hypothetical protein
MSLRLSPLRRRAIAVLVLIGALVLALVFNRHEPIGEWLQVRYLRAALLASVFSLSCLVAGHAALVRILRRVLPLEEHLAIAFPLGVIAFFVASVAFGLLGLYGSPFFYFGPAVLVALGARDFTRLLARWRRHAAGLDLRLALDGLSAAILLFGCLGVAVVWLTILTPLNASHDARSYHLPIAEQYVVSGGIVRFDDGWVRGAFPQLASLLYAWAFSVPGALFDKVETAAHVELAIFFMTLLGVAAMVRRISRERAPLSWCALFLFPGIFCYDSGLVLGADHVAALFAAPIFLVSLRYHEAPSRAHAVLLGALLAGALGTKYTAVILLPLPLVLAATAACSARERARDAMIALTTLLALTAPHWLKNALFYDDPLFPALHALLPSAPWSKAAELPYSRWYALHHPPLGLSTLFAMVQTLVTFSFAPHDFPQFHRDLPVFGSLFTLCTPLVLFVNERRRLRWLMLGSYLGIATWFWIHEFDRYLQVLVPWMAAGTAVVLRCLWQAGRSVRVALAAMVGLQIAWGGAVPFFPTHRGAGDAVLKVVADLFARGYRGESANPPVAYPEWEAISRALPPGAKVLVHEEPARAGLGARSVLDLPGEQGAFYWGEPTTSTPLEVWQLLRTHGVTHLIWAEHLDHGIDTIAAALVFFDFVAHHTRVLGTFGGFVLAELGEAPQPRAEANEVAYYGCDEPPDPAPEPVNWDPIWRPRDPFRSRFAPGLYTFAAFSCRDGDRRPLCEPRPDVTQDEAIGHARFLVFDARCHRLPADARDRFELLAARGESMLLETKER